MTTVTPVATTIMIIRHGEKPPEAPAFPPPFGITPDGVQDDHSLSVRGWQRAGALATFFGSFGSAPSSVSSPQFIYAVKVDGDNDNSRDRVSAKIGTKGKRTQQTVAPLAEKLGSAATLNLAFDKGDEEAMIASAMACPGVVLICWVHEDIPRLASLIPTSSTTPVPETWPTDAPGHGRFDLVWAFDFDNTGGTYRFSQIPQMLLAGDLPE